MNNSRSHKGSSELRSRSRSSTRSSLRSTSKDTSSSSSPRSKSSTPGKYKEMRNDTSSRSESRDRLTDELEAGEAPRSRGGVNRNDGDMSPLLGEKEESADIKVVKSTSLGTSDKLSMGLLFVLYALQGIPMGLSTSLPLILKERGTKYDDLALFSLISMPFSMKLLWAPIVDSCFIEKVGRRKTWLIPVQLLTALCLILGSPYVEAWLGGEVTEHNPLPPNVKYLTAFFLLLYFLMATQDIAVDGWALTMLSKENVGYASTCNSVGQMFGFFLSNQGFIAFSDPHWCHTFLGLSKGTTLVSLSSLMSIAGWIFVIVTVLIWLFKTEEPLSAADEPDGLCLTYKHVFSIAKLKSVQTIMFVLLTVKVAFAPADAVMAPQLQDYGMPKADIATFSPIILVMGLVLPAVVAEWVIRDPVKMIQKGIVLKLVTSSLGWLVVRRWGTAHIRRDGL